MICDVVLKACENILVLFFGLAVGLQMGGCGGEVFFTSSKVHNVVKTFLGDSTQFFVSRYVGTLCNTVQRSK